MSEPYTPTTEEVRNTFSAATWEWGATTLDDAEQEFDRWLAEVKAQAWEEGKTAGFEDAWGTRAVNPYRQGEN